MEKAMRSYFRILKGTVLMKIYELAVEHRKEPLGIDGDDPLFSFLCDGDGTFSVSVFDSTGKKVAENARLSFGIKK